MPLDSNTGNPVETPVADVPAEIGAPDTSTPAAKPDMADTIRQALRSQATKATADDLADRSYQEPGRQRGADGKFVPNPKANGAAGAPVITPPEEGADPAAEETTEVAAQPKAHDTPPNTWRKEIAAQFGTLPENVREEIHRRENDFHKGIGQYKEAAEFGTVMAQELVPYQGVMAQHNVNAREVVKSLAASWNMLVTGSPQQKTNLVLQLIKDHAIELPSLGSTPPQDQAQPTQDDPRLAAALQRLDKLEGNLTAQERQRAEAEYATHLDAVGKFGSNPKNEHFNAVRGEMAALLNSGQATDLQDAYDKAIWLKPDVRGSLLAKQEKERADKTAKEAAAARVAAGANVTRRGTPPVPPKAGKIEDTIRAEYRRLNGGA